MEVHAHNACLTACVTWWFRYTDLTECMDSISLEELIMAVRRQSQGFSRGTSAYRGVTHHPSGETNPPLALALDTQALNRRFHSPMLSPWRLVLQGCACTSYSCWCGHI